MPSVQRNPQDISSFYLAHIYQQLSTQPNGSQPSIPSGLTNPIEPFTPHTSAIWINGLWVLSLILNLTSALLAILVQQWGVRYLRVAYPPYTAHMQARIRAFYNHGAEGQQLIPWTIEAIPVLLHISLFLFFAGLSVFLFGIHPTIFKVATAWIGICVVLYAYLTVLPIFYKNSLCFSPLSMLVSFCLTGIRCGFFLLLQKFPHFYASIYTLLHSRDPRAVHLDDFFSHSMSKTAEEYAFRLNPGIDHRSLIWTFRSLDNDTDLEKFFGSFSRCCDSEIGKKLNLQQGFIRQNKEELSNALIGLIDRTLSSNLISAFVKQRRMVICGQAMVSNRLEPWWILRRVFFGDWTTLLGSVEFGLLVKNVKSFTQSKVTSFYAQCVAALVMSTVRNRDERWYQLASDLPHLSKSLLHKYIESGDSLLLVHTIFIARRTVQTYSSSAELRNDIIDASSKTLQTLCELDIRRTSPELQHNFCGLWNQLVETANDPRRFHPVFVSTVTLKNIRKLFFALHEGSGTPVTAFNATIDDWDPILDNPMFYPTCTIDGHHPDLPAPDLLFDETPSDAPGDGPPAPVITHMPLPFSHVSAHSSNFLTPFNPPPLGDSAPYQPSSVPTHHGGHLAEPRSHLGVPSQDDMEPFSQLQSTRPDALNVSRGVDAQPPPSDPLLSPA